MTSIPWSAGGEQLLIDTHAHTRFSDGALTVAHLADLGDSHDCDVMVFSDHEDSENFNGEQFLNALQSARTAHPQQLLFAGQELNIPPYGGREHVVAILHPRIEAMLATYQPSKPTITASAVSVLKAFDEVRQQSHDVALFYAHPSRKDRNAGENREDILDWRGVTDVVVGFEGAPGHQKDSRIGSYRGSFKPVDRWDPVVAQIGNDWDYLLERGHDVWAAIAPSDYHNNQIDSAPCDFSRTYLHAPDRTYDGVLKALHAGSFWAVHGDFVRHLKFTVNAPELLVPAVAGETIATHRESRLEVAVTFQRATSGDDPIVVEIIGNARRGVVEVLDSARLVGDAAEIVFTYSEISVGVDRRSAYFRARLTQHSGNGEKLVAYTNPIRVVPRTK